MSAFCHGQLVQMMREEVRLSVRKNKTLDEEQRQAALREEIKTLLNAGLDEFPSFRPSRVNPHDD